MHQRLQVGRAEALAGEERDGAPIAPNNAACGGRETTVRRL